MLLFISLLLYFFIVHYRICHHLQGSYLLIGLLVYNLSFRARYKIHEGRHPSVLFTLGHHGCAKEQPLGMLYKYLSSENMFIQQSLASVLKELIINLLVALKPGCLQD